MAVHHAPNDWIDSSHAFRRLLATLMVIALGNGAMYVVSVVLPAVQREFGVSRAQAALPYTLLIVDDGGYGMLRYDQIVMGHPERGVDLVSPDWAVLAQAFGLSFTEATLEDLPEALTLKQPGIVLLREKLHPPKSTSPRWNEK